jgi:hypothetical protein
MDWQGQFRRTFRGKNVLYSFSLAQESTSFQEGAFLLRF